MNNKINYALCVLVAFALGVLSTYLIMTKQQMDLLLQAKQQTVNANNSLNTTPLSDNMNQEDVNASLSHTDVSNIEDALAHKATADKSVSVKDYSQEQAQAIIDDMPDVVLEQYIDKFMAKDASSEINDKRRFAQRAIEELYTANDNRPLAGEIKLSFDSTMPSQSVELGTIDKDAKVYAHLDTQGKVPASPYVFVKWVNNQTGQVLLFEKKDIVADQNQNWVSFRPYDGWQVGSYDIRFYQFTSELVPIAQLTYNIYNVIDTTNN